MVLSMINLQCTYIVTTLSEVTMNGHHNDKKEVIKTRDTHHRPEDSGFVTAKEQPEESGFATMATQLNVAKYKCNELEKLIIDQKF